MSHYEHIVVGAGIVGSCTALYLARNGAKVVLLEQFPIPHTRGSSHGASRMIRSCYSEDHFAALMPDAFAMWKEIEQLSGSNILARMGVLCMGVKGSRDFDSSLFNMKQFCPKDLILLTADDIRKTYPSLRFPSNYDAFMDNTGGVIVANRALSAVQDLYKKSGGHLWDGCQVTGIEPSAEMSTEYKVSTSKGQVIAPSVIICAGCWCKDLLVPSFLPEIPLQPAAVNVFYWRDTEHDKHSAASGFPAFIDLSNHKGNVYGLPSLEYPSLVKVSIPCDPNDRYKVGLDVNGKNAIQEYIKRHFPALETTPSIVEDCMYTLTPDENFILDHIPGNENIIIGCGFSGTGFKTAPVVGKLLAEMASGKPPSHDLSPFSLARFGL